MYTAITIRQRYSKLSTFALQSKLTSTNIMKINLEKTNRIISILIVLVIVAGAISAIFLNEVQRIIVGVGVVLGVLNLLGVRYFFNKNNRPRNQR